MLHVALPYLPLIARGRHCFAVGLALLVATGAPLGAQQNVAGERAVTALDLYQLRAAGNVALSPDGRRVAYVVTEVDSAENRYQRDLWIAATDGSGAPRRVTWTSSASLGSPAWSPDGRSIAFTTSREEGRGQIWILPLADGGEAWPLTSLETGASGPVWSPDGSRIAFTSSLTPQQLAGDTASADTAKAAVDGAAIRNIAADRAAALRAIRAKLENNAEANDPRRVTRLDYLGETSIEDERYAQLYTIEVRPRAEPRQLTRAGFRSSSPAWSPDGQMLVYSAAPPRGDYHPDYEQESDLFIIPASGGEPRRIEEPGSGESNPAFSSDGRWIVYERQREDSFPTASNTVLMAMRADGSARRSITGAMDRSVGDFRITDDGWLYFTAASEGSVGLHRVRIDRGEPQPVVRGRVGS